MDTILEHLTPFTERMPPEGIDLFVCEENDSRRRYGIMRFFIKGSLLPGCCGNHGKTPEERLLERIFRDPDDDAFAPATGFYRYEKIRSSDGRKGAWVKSSINPLDAAYIAINPEELE